MFYSYSFLRVHPLPITDKYTNKPSNKKSKLPNCQNEGMRLV